jgi:hypothetical protein
MLAMLRRVKALLERQGQMTAPPGDRGQLDFLQHVQRIFDAS